ncbi:MAG: hypothetical protein QG673_150, partial [Pseudomonadota bacterium]|nr:hypothetical protein [Pseudomonadota bacterium]
MGMSLNRVPRTQSFCNNKSNGFSPASHNKTEVSLFHPNPGVTTSTTAEQFKSQSSLNSLRKNDELMGHGGNCINNTSNLDKTANNSNKITQWVRSNSKSAPSKTDKIRIGSKANLESEFTNLKSEDEKLAWVEEKFTIQQAVEILRKYGCQNNSLCDPGSGSNISEQHAQEILKTLDKNPHTGGLGSKNTRKSWLPSFSSFGLRQIKEFFFGKAKITDTTQILGQHSELSRLLLKDNHISSNKKQTRSTPTPIMSKPPYLNYLMKMVNGDGTKSVGSPILEEVITQEREEDTLQSALPPDSEKEAPYNPYSSPEIVQPRDTEKKDTLQSAPPPYSEKEAPYNPYS